MTFDAIGMVALERVHRNCRNQGNLLLFSGVQLQAMNPLEQSGLVVKIARENFPPNLDTVLVRATEMIPAKKEDH